MKLLRPFTVTAANLISNIAETGTEYAVSATYALAEVVIETVGTAASHHSYESLVVNNVGNALTDTTKWLDLGPTNKFAMFDTANGTSTTGASIDVTVAVTGRADGLALLGLSATSVAVTMTAGAYGTVYSQTFSLQSDSAVDSWYDYFSEEIVYKTDLVLIDLPLYTDPQINVIITGNTTVSCGTMSLGQTRDLGAAVYGARAGIQDYSKKDVDAFGNYTIVPRAFAKRTSLKLVTDNAQIDELHAMLASYRTTPAVWIGTDDYACTWVFGFYKDFAVEIAQLQKSYITLEIEGLT